MYESRPACSVNIPMENGRAAANSELFGRLAPRTNALIRPRSVVKSTIRLSYSPIGMADRTIPFTVTVSICFPFYKLTSRPRDIQNSSYKDRCRASPYAP